ncbi:4-coumarate--CoA ligase-like 6 [Malania oleifera]|uniref:4-coumarate--CoA ligase-like 6 n=1 Tax=Malania oleifera TaxID=397392 RepID=UPI0025AE00D9|nr:4-coumarate--CoA ligase-like 6 [Malania oleifera]
MNSPLTRHGSRNEEPTTVQNTTSISQKLDRPNYEHYWFCPETRIYNSKHPPRHIPSDPYLDVVSFIFSHRHNGVSALIDSSSGSSLSYSELFPLVKSVASGLREMGISQGDVVMILLPNSIYFPVILLGVLYVGAIVTTMNPLSSLSETKKRILDCCVRLAFTVAGKVENLKTLGVSTVEVPENANLDSELNDFPIFNKLISGNFGVVSRPVINQQDTAAIMSSSGTTGVSKGVVLTHGNFIAMIELFVRFEASQYENLPSENVYLAILPMFHIYGLSLFAMGFLSLGSSIVVMRKFDVDEAVNVIDRYKVTHFPVVPSILRALTVKAKCSSGRSLESLKQVSCGAAPLSRKVIDNFIQTLPHVDFIQGYGMTESTAIGTRGFNTQKLRKYTSVGLLAPNMQAKIVYWKSGSPMPPGESGELLIRGPGVMKGYLNNVKATTLIIDKDGWLHTGDIAYFDHDGYLYIIDRLKDVIKYKGFQIAPADLEAVLFSHPEVLDAAVVAARDETAGEVPVAFVVKKHGSALSESTIIDYVAQQVAPYKKVRKVVFTDVILKSATGKVLRRELKNLLTSKI